MLLRPLRNLIDSNIILKHPKSLLCIISMQTQALERDYKQPQSTSLQILACRDSWNTTSLHRNTKHLQ